MTIAVCLLYMTLASDSVYIPVSKYLQKSMDCFQRVNLTRPKIFWFTALSDVVEQMTCHLWIYYYTSQYHMQNKAQDQSNCLTQRKIIYTLPFSLCQILVFLSLTLSVIFIFISYLYNLQELFFVSLWIWSCYRYM